MKEEEEARAPGDGSRIVRGAEPGLLLRRRRIPGARRRVRVRVSKTWTCEGFAGACHCGFTPLGHRVTDPPAACASDVAKHVVCCAAKAAG